jgi:serine/threonine-protein kinase
MDRDLLLGAMTLQDGFIDAAQFVEVLKNWMGQSAAPKATLSGLIAERGWITPADWTQLEAELDRDPGGATAYSPTGTYPGRLVGLASTEPACGDEPTQDWVAPTEVRPDVGRAEVATLSDPPRTRRRYRLARLHAEGGIGKVWLAYDAHLGREVALKELRPDRAASPTLAARFLEEARITGQLEHPGIVPIYELAEPEGDRRSFYTMRFVRGRTLSNAIRAYHRPKAPARDEALELLALLNAFVAVCNAVAYAHSRGVIHRDLKGANVVLGDFGEVVVLDWGLAKLVDRPDDGRAEASPVVVAGEGRGETRMGQALGTPAYMSPEQAKGLAREVGPASDIYGLGAILYEILAGRPPFAGDEPRDILRQVVEDEPTRPRSLRPSAPAALEAVCLKAMAKDPAARYASASELAQEVRRYLADEPVAAYPEPLSRRLGRWARRHRPAVAAASALLVAAVVALSTGLYLVGKERDRAEQASSLATLRLRLAREAIKGMLANVADRRLAHIPQMDGLRAQLAGEAINGYNRLLATGPYDPELRREAVQVYRRGANLYRLANRFTPALSGYNAAIRLLTERGDRTHDTMQDSVDIAETEREAAELLRLHGRPREAESRYRRSVDLAEALRTRAPGVAHHDRLAAVGLLDLGHLQHETGRLGASRESLERAVALLRPLANHPDPRSNDAVLMVLAEKHLGAILRDLGDATGAGRVFDEALGRARDEIARRSDNDRRWALATLRIEQGWLLAADPALRNEADVAFEEAITLLEWVSDEFPALPHYREDLALAHEGRAAALTASRRIEPAADHFRKARDLALTLTSESPDVPRYQGLLGRILAALGRQALDRGRPDEAEALLSEGIDRERRALTANPDDAVVDRSLKADRAAWERLRHSPGGTPSPR